MSWVDRETARWLRGKHAPVSSEKRWWEVTTNGEFVGVHATLGTSDEIRELVTALQAYIPFFEEMEAAAQGIAAGTDETSTAAQPEGQEPGPKDAHNLSGNPSPGDTND